jgi:uncharacterized protein (TIGR03089 family)
VTVADLLAREARRDSARPLLTWYDDALGARVELSVATAGNWAAKLANLLTDEYDVEPGIAVSVRLLTHWETAVVLLGAWTAGGCVVIDGDADVSVGLDGTGADIELRLDPMGGDLARLAAAQPDIFTPIVPPSRTSDALRIVGRTWTHEQLEAAAHDGAVHHGLTDGSRVLSTLGYDTVDGLDAGLLVPLSAGASVVLVTNADRALLADRCATEKVTHVADARGLHQV